MSLDHFGLYRGNMLDRAAKIALTTNAIQGRTQQEIADRTGIPQTTVSRYLRKDKIKAIIELGQQKIAARALKPAIDNMIELVKDYKNPIIDPENKAELQKKDHAFKMTVKVLESHGLVGATQSHTVNQVFVQNNQQFISPVVDRALEMAMKTPQDVVIDSECDESE